MDRKKVDSNRERRLLIALIMSKPFLAQASSVLDPSLIDAPHFRQIAEWCLDYYREYGKAPELHIVDLYNAWAEENENTSLVESIHDFLEALSEEYEKEIPKDEFNVPFLIDQLGLFLSHRQMKKLHDDISYSLVQGEYKEAESLVTAYKSVEVGLGSGFDPLNDNEVWERAFADPMKPLIEFPGAAGSFFAHSLQRDSLIGIQAPEKTGKTMWCVEFVWRALRQRKKVALFEVGDLSESQIVLRMGVRFADRPLWKRLCGDIPIPSRIRKDPDEDAGYSVISKKAKRNIPLTKRAVFRGRKRFRRANGLGKKTYLMTSVHSLGSISVRGIEAVLDQWLVEREFIPDVIVIDYADILAPEDSKKQGRDQINDTWKALRRLSQERHALVIAPTQADAGTYSQEITLQTMKNFSEDKRKLGHVTGMFALNQSPAEKDMNGMRLNWIVLREAPFNIRRCLYVGTCFALGRALCCSTL